MHALRIFLCEKILTCVSHMPIDTVKTSIASFTRRVLDHSGSRTSQCHVDITRPPRRTALLPFIGDSRQLAVAVRTWRVLHVELGGRCFAMF